ncbi:hypothetical protein BN7_5084 [Wickerhamomyces ciferrii]|uniref:Uncharacterized protein n=1 Tax=Wickerhamomyces ciferrii (strain ATCC 14091 / BCRC 22168 / CBS 111 / JCM 3599 / NBRC 0793 / NRRL Y-1031 F-60-10) TaxID=1206466 RepID=K0KU03_WICCF|nr:uncharacterized protein BN7_5084 [Wickerhamomyces ciferrii]CCH45502.1 hypothetical protein BN7_5084 [Wickerhamomyces ciferrii]
MSLNWIMRTPNGVNPPFVLLDGENVKYTSPQPIEIKLKAIQLEKPDVITIKGSIYLTDKRLVVLSTGAGNQDNDSFSLLYKDMISHKLEMPWFGSNSYKILFKITSEQSGLNYLYTWQSNIQFPQGGAIQFHEEFSKLKTWFDNNQEDEPLPAYTG